MDVKEWLKKTGSTYEISGSAIKLAQSLVGDQEIQYAFNPMVEIFPTLKYGTEKGNSKPESDFKTKRGIVLLLSDKLLFVSKTFFGGIITEQLALKDIQSVNLERTFFSLGIWHLKIMGIANTFVMSDGKKELMAFRPVLDNLITSNKSSDYVVAAGAEPTIKEQIRGLKELLDDGLITQEEFEKKRKQILGV